VIGVAVAAETERSDPHLQHGYVQLGDYSPQRRHLGTSTVRRRFGGGDDVERDVTQLAVLVCERCRSRLKAGSASEASGENRVRIRRVGASGNAGLTAVPNADARCSFAFSPTRASADRQASFHEPFTSSCGRTVPHSRRRVAQNALIPS